MSIYNGLIIVLKLQKKNTNKINRFFPIWFILVFFICFNPNSLLAQKTNYDFATGALQEGSLTDGFIETAFGNFGGVRINFLEQTTHDVLKVPGADVQLSTQYDETSRREIDLLIPFSNIPLPALRSAYAGLSVIRIKEESTATFVIVDELGEFGTDYTHSRDTVFYSPRIGATFEGDIANIGSSSLHTRYTLTLSPVYYFTIDQKMDFHYTDHELAPEPIKKNNNVSDWALPYLNQDLNMRIGSYLRLNLQHAYQFLPYKSIQLTSDGTDVEVVDDPTHMNSLRVNGDLTLPVGSSVSLNIGLGYQWNWTYRTADWVSKDGRTDLATVPYVRIGSSFN